MSVEKRAAEAYLDQYRKDYRRLSSWEGAGRMIAAHAAAFGFIGAMLAKHIASGERQLTIALAAALIGALSAIPLRKWMALRQISRMERKLD